MDIDFSNLLRDDPGPSSGSLLSNLPHRTSTDDSSISCNTSGHTSSSQPNTANTPDPSQTGRVIAKIENIFESITDCILDQKKELVISLRSRPKCKSKDSEESTLNLKLKPELKNFTFPSKSPQETWKFTALLRILELSHEALVTGIVTTKRDIYYREPELFIKQAVVDRYVDDIAYTFGVGRDALNVAAAAKGLVVGSFAITRQDKSVVDYSVEPAGLLVPSSKEIDEIRIDVEWMLVIEKEATFSTLATSQYWKDSISGRGILITAKGYPDIQTRQFLHLLSTRYPELPIFALVDFDPDGIGIMSTYKHGSMNLAHETNLAVRSIQWLGVRSCDFLHQTEGDVQGLLKLTARDRKIALKLLEKQPSDGGGLNEDWGRELQIMLMLNVKVEIQILGGGEVLGEWLDSKLLHVSNSHISSNTP